MKKISIASFLSRLSQRERYVFYGAALIVGIALLDQLILSPILSKINRLDEEITLFREAVEQNIIIISQEERILAERKSYAPYLSKPQSEEKEVTTFLKEIETEAKDSSVYLVDIRSSGLVEEDTTKQYFLEIEFEAQMEQVLRFFHAIETADKLFKIEEYRIRPKAEGSRIAACSASVSKTVIPK